VTWHGPELPTVVKTKGGREPSAAGEPMPRSPLQQSPTSKLSLIQRYKGIRRGGVLGLRAGMVAVGLRMASPVDEWFRTFFFYLSGAPREVIFCKMPFDFVRQAVHADLRGQTAFAESKDGRQQFLPTSDSRYDLPSESHRDFASTERDREGRSVPAENKFKKCQAR